MSDSFEECQKDSLFAKQSLVDAGFLINEEELIVCCCGQMSK
jgi:hypothetical protein